MGQLTSEGISMKSLATAVKAIGCHLLRWVNILVIEWSALQWWKQWLIMRLRHEVVTTPCRLGSKQWKRCTVEGCGKYWKVDKNWKVNIQQYSISVRFDVEMVSFIIPHLRVFQSFRFRWVSGNVCAVWFLRPSYCRGEKSIEMEARYDSYNHGVNGIQIGCSMMLDIYMEGPSARKLNLQVPKGVAGWVSSQTVQLQLFVTKDCEARSRRLLCVPHFWCQPTRMFGVEEDISRQMFAETFVENWCIRIFNIHTKISENTSFWWESHFFN